MSSKESIIGTIPNDWGMLSISEVSKVIDSLHQTPTYSDNGVPMVRVTDIKEDGLALENCLRVSNENYELFTRNHKPMLGDIVISRVGTYGVFSYVKTSEKFCLGQNTAIISPEINSKYLFYNLINKRTKYQIDNLAVGSTQKTISLKNIKALKIPICDDNEQKAIADTLSCLDDKIELNNRINKTLEEMAQAIFKSWFVDFEPFQDGEFEESELGRIPRGWRVGVLSDLGKIIGGGTPSTKREDYFILDGIPWITPKDLSICKDKYINRGQQDITELGLKESSAKLMPKGTVLFSSRAPIGYIAISKNSVTTNQGFKSIIPNQNVGSEFIYYVLKNNTDEIENRASGSTFKEISGSEMKKIPVIIPDNETLEKYNIVMDGLGREQMMVEDQNKTLVLVRDTLLPKLMSGEIRVTPPVTT